MFGTLITKEKVHGISFFQQFRVVFFQRHQ